MAPMKRSCTFCGRWLRRGPCWPCVRRRGEPWFWLFVITALVLAGVFYLPFFGS